MDVDLYKSRSLVRIWNQTPNEVVNYTLNTESIHSTSSVGQLFVNIGSEETERKA